MSAIPTRTDLLNMINPLASAENVLRLATIKALYTAAQAATTGLNGFTTAAISKGSATGPAVGELFLELGENGYTVNNGSTTFTVTC